MHTILAIDDEESVRQSYWVIFSDFYRVILSEDGESGLVALDENHVDIILLDLTMPGLSGEAFLKELRQRGSTVPVIIITASNTVTTAVDAMKLGARDYVIKPFDVDAVLHDVERIIAEEHEKRQLEALKQAEASGFDALIGEATSFREALGKARQAAAVDSTVLITGESGTGKDLIARAIHSSGPRSEEAFVPIPCCAIPSQLVEDELFGHEKGAYTGADQNRVGKLQVADGGTLFLDEIGEMPLEAQAKLLRVLQDGQFCPVGSNKVIEVDIRVICATNRDLMKSVKDGTFREDLFYRINVLQVESPSLRQRRDDIPLLVEHFVTKHRQKVNADSLRVAPKAMARLASYDWPGNVRELENTIERLLVYYGQHETIGADHVESLLPDGAEKEEMTFDQFEGLPIEEATRRMETYLITRALERSGNVQSRAADLLGTTRRVLKYKMDQLEIPSREKSA